MTTRHHDDEHYLRERYAGGGRRPPGMTLYYRLKPSMPRRLQLALRRAHARLRMRRSFPAWPIEPLLVERQHSRFREQLAEADGAHVPFVNFWPERRRFAAVLTHDVEGPAGIEMIPRVREVERRHGVVSSWNFVAEDYPIPPGLFDDLRAEGCEIGLHGIHHDGRLFKSRASFEAALPPIRRYLQEWGAEGFRSPATHRNADWIAELGCLYDSSIPDTDPFEPQPGGCCSIFPFMLGDVVELPVTLVQDHTLFEILRRPTIELWTEKAAWIARNHGLVNVIVHPDYLLEAESLDRYEQLLGFLRSLEGGWHALPREVAAWWRQRERLGAAAPGATPAHALERDGRIVFDV